MFKKHDFIRHPKIDWGIGVVLFNSDGKTVTALFESVGKKTLSLKHILPTLVKEPIDFNVNKTSLAHKTYTSTYFNDIYYDVKSEYPNHLIFIENGCYYEVLNDDAEELSLRYDWKTYERQESITTTGFPTTNKHVWNDLNHDGTPYIIVSQLPQTSQYISRKITKIFPSLSDIL